MNLDSEIYICELIFMCKHYGDWAMSERPENRRSIPGVCRGVFSWLVCLGGLQAPPNLSLEVKRQGRGLKRISHLNLVRIIRINGSILPLPPTLCSIKHRHNFTFIPDLLRRCLIFMNILCIYWLAQISHRAYPEDGRSVHLRIIGIHLSDCSMPYSEENNLILLLVCDNFCDGLVIWM
jgi:hypothetical protein